MAEASDALAHYVRSEAGLLVASLTRELGDFDLAEEAVQDAILEALRHWPAAGVPRQPGAWLRVTARRSRRSPWRSDTANRARCIARSSGSLASRQALTRVPLVRPRPVNFGQDGLPPHIG
jgi:RNA polymerase sigma-70 factor (ECF subfamily)